MKKRDGRHSWAASRGNRVKWVGAVDHAIAKSGQVTEGICVADPKTGRLLEVCIPKKRPCRPEQYSYLAWRLQRALCDKSHPARVETCLDSGTVCSRWGACMTRIEVD